MAPKLDKPEKEIKDLITYVKDRPGHDQRYAINCDKIKNLLNWKPSLNFEKGLELTVDWYLKNKLWIKNITTGEYKQWINNNYGKR